MARVFLSFTPPELVEYRSAAYDVLQRLGHQVVSLQVFRPSAQSPIAAGPAVMTDADVVVVIMGWTFGTPPPGGGLQSPLEFEYQQARSIGKPTLVLLSGNESRVQPEVLGGVSYLHRVETFRKQLSADNAVDFFASVEEFRERLAMAIAAWERKRNARPPTVTVEQLPLAWRLVVDFKAKPDLLRHLDGSAFTKALEQWEEQSGADSSKPWPDRLARALSELETKQLPHAPNPLWLAWMRATQAVEPPPRDSGQPGPTPVPNDPPARKRSKNGPPPSSSAA